jgi:hypothetical protein
MLAPEVTEFGHNHPLPPRPLGHGGSGLAAGELAQNATNGSSAMSTQQTNSYEGPRTLPERIAFHAAIVVDLEEQLLVERTGLYEAIVDTLSERGDDGKPRWTHDQIRNALVMLAGRDARSRMLMSEGRKVLSVAQASQVCVTLAALERAREEGNQTQANALRASLRKIPFYLSDWRRSGHAFRLTDFDRLVSYGLIEIR